MATVTRIAPQQRAPNRVSVFIDGRFAFGLPVDVAAHHGVTVGTDLSPAKITELRHLDDAAKATDAALRLLAHRPRSTQEIRSRLGQKGFTPDAIEMAIDRLEGWRYLDDAEFARSWVESRAEHRPRGSRLIKRELQQKGLDRETIREAIAGADIDERAAARRLAEQRLRTLSGEPELIRRRLAGYLARRGYDWDVVKPVLDEVLGDQNNGEA